MALSNGSLRLLCAGFGPCVAVWNCLWLERPDQAFPRDAITLKCRVLSLYLPFEKLLLVGGACSQTLCLPQHTAGATDGLVCVVIFLSPQDRNHFGVVLSLLGLLEHSQVCGTALGELWPRAYQSGKIYKRM